MAEAKQMLPYSKREVACAVKLSALLGWGGVIGIPLLAQSFKNGLNLDWIALVFWYALFGLPISLFICWLLVKPFLRVMMRRNISFIRAAYWGAGIGLGIVALRVSITRYLGWHKSLDPNTHSGYGDGRVIEFNGILTNYGWWVLAQNSAEFILMCTLAALAVRLIIGPGKYNLPIESNQ